jgi:hypothetical protein
LELKLEVQLCATTNIPLGKSVRPLEQENDLLWSGVSLRITVC